MAVCITTDNSRIADDSQAGPVDLGNALGSNGKCDITVPMANTSVVPHVDLHLNGKTNTEAPPSAETVMIFATENSNGDAQQSDKLGLIRLWKEALAQPREGPVSSANSELVKDANEQVQLIAREDLGDYASAEELANKIVPEALKQSLQRYGLKCGGTPQERAARLFLLKSVPLENLPKSVFAK